MVGAKTRQTAYHFSVAVAALLGAICADGAQAKSKIKKITAPVETVSNLGPSPSAPAAVRFFTIQQVLAKHDSRRTSSSVRFASTQPAGNATDGTSALRAMTSDEPFGLFTFRAPEGLLWVKWRRVERDIKADLETLKECFGRPENCGSAAARQFASVINEAKAHHGRDRIETVNRRINSLIAYVSDRAQHGVPDLWTGPLATLDAGRGDCEDYAIAKYVALREAGVPADSVRFLLVRDRVAGDHAVLGVRQEGRWLILDNRYTALADAEDLRHFTPLFALDQDGVKLFAAPYSNRDVAQASAPAAQWDDSRVPPIAAAVVSLDAGPGAWSVVALAL